MISRLAEVYRTKTQEKIDALAKKLANAQSNRIKYFFQQQIDQLKWEIERGWDEPASPLKEGDEIRKNRKSWSNVQKHATSPFSFVPLNPIICPPEDVWSAGADGINLHSRTKPLEDGLCAEIELEWQVETPLLVGTQLAGDGVTTVVPTTMDGRSTWVIPASTLRGHIRSMLQIVAYGRLWPFNHQQRFGIRDFLHPHYGGESAVAKATQVQAGWLTVTGDKWEISPCNWDYIQVENIDGGKSWPDWVKKALKKKYDDIGYENSNGQFCFTNSEKRSFVDAGERTGKRVLQPVGTNKTVEGWYVFSGKANVPKEGPNNKTKRFEYIFHERSGAAPTLLKDISIRRFSWANSKTVGNRLEKLGSWKDFEATLDAGMRVPVFYVGNLENQPTDFSFGFTRMFKIAHKFSIGDMARNVNPHHLPMADADKTRDSFKPDFVENLFGYVYEKEMLGLENSPQRKGRISFGFATTDPDNFEQMEPVTTILGSPQPSFSPFYLAGNIKDWSSTGSTLIGRKRYLPRYVPANLSNACNDINARLKRQVDLAKIASNGREPGDKVKSKLKFLRPKPNQSAVFKSKIKLFNVTKAELGGVLWALTFGGNAEKYRHMLGHARPFGAGQVKLSSAKLNVMPNLRKNETWEGIPLENNEITNCTHDLFLKAFETHMKTSVGANWPATPVIEELLKTCDPEVWQNQSQRLQYPTFPSGFVALRKATQLLIGENEPLPDAPPAILRAPKSS